jgi:type II secretory pathway pseudopilin PulG
MVRQYVTKIFRGKTGFTMVEILLAVGLAGAVAVGVAGAITYTSGQSQEVRLFLAAKRTRENLIQQLNSARYWDSMIMSNQSTNPFFCIANRSDCSVLQTATPVKFYDPNDTSPNPSPVYDSSVASNGFTMGGQPCNSYTGAPGNNVCPFRFNVTITAICPGSPCIDPILRVVGAFTYSPPVANTSPGAAMQLPVNLLSFNFIRNYERLSTSAACTALSMTYDSATGTCKHNLAGKQCGAHQYVTSINNATSSTTASISCGYFVWGTCSAGQMVTHVNTTTGQVLCDAYMGSAACPLPRPACPTYP